MACPEYWPKERIRMITRETMAAGRAMAKLARNLSFIWQPCPLQAAMVVSEIKERLSPNKAPPMTAATHRGMAKVIRVIVPTEVPMAKETKQLTTKRTATANWAGITDRRK